MGTIAENRRRSQLRASIISNTLMTQASARLPWTDGISIRRSRFEQFEPVAEIIKVFLVPPLILFFVLIDCLQNNVLLRNAHNWGLSCRAEFLTPGGRVGDSSNG